MRVRSVAWLLLVLVVTLTARSPSARADDATAQARSHYEMGLQLFDAREHEQALIEFERANELKSRPAALFMMAQCEYLLGRLKDARAHYARYVTENPTGEFVELAKDRVDSIDKRPSTFVINTVPDDVTVLIRREPAAGPVAAPDVTGQAPNNFQVPRGRYRIDVTKPNYQGQTRIVEVDVAETKPLFFKLDPIPARLEITTAPEGATLYVNGNRARNPYAQDVPPGRYEIFAEAAQHDSRTVELTLSPGEQRKLVGPNLLSLPYVRRSGRPEIIVASGVIGAFIGAGAVAAAIGKPLQSPGVASVFLVTGGGLAGAVGGALIAAPLVPRYIPDNRALYVIGGMWIGGAEGAGLGMVWNQVSTRRETVVGPCTGPSPCRPALGEQLRAGFIGSLPGLALGLTAAGLTSERAPTYGRAALIQSAALGGMFTGALTQLALKWQPYGAGWEETVRAPTTDDATKAISGEAPQMSCTFGLSQNCVYRETSVMDLAPGALIGLNVGLAAGLLGAYVPDQSKYGPTWRRVLIVDLAVGTGMLAGGITGCVANTDHCLLGEPDNQARAIVGASALAGGAIGLVSGLVLTRHFDDDTSAPSGPSSITVAPLTLKDGAGFVALGSF
ncbi:MAG TPA: tetratricopeptide repeat protein [Polyangia bacterium]|nr:tetratricopeptide repeat protein [Polyangia bacterium]